jgi:hypothetical protein
MKEKEIRRLGDKEKGRKVDEDHLPLSHLPLFPPLDT